MTETAHTPLPCPFCGGEAKTVSPLGFGNVRAIECCNSDDCAATGPWACNEAEALTAWNTRAVNSHHDLIEALREELVWHEDHDKAISKQPNANTGDNGWRRMEHQERIAALTAILTKAEAGR